MATYYWVGGDGTWNGASTANWSASSGGAAGAGPPNNADTVVFDAASGTGTCTTASGATCAVATLNSATLGLTLGANLTLSGAFTLTQGALSLGGFTLTANNFSSSNANTRSIAFGSGKIAIAGNGITVWTTGTATNFSVSGTPVVELTYSGTSGTRVVSAHSTDGTEANVVSFSVTAGTDAVNFGANSRVKNLVYTGFKGTQSTNAFSVYGSVTVDAGMTFSATTNAISFISTSPQTITSNGVSIDRPITFNGAGGTWALVGALTIGATRALTLTNGTLDANNQNVSLGSFALGAGTKTLTLGSGTWTVAGANWNANTNVTGLTVSPSTGTISMTSASSKTFAGGGLTWPTLNQGGAGALTIQQSNTFANITDTVQPATVTLTSGTTQTVTAFSLAGTAGNLITLNASTPGSQATLTDNSNINSVSYVSITDIAATGSSEWQAYTSNGNVDGGNNAGWVFTAPPPLTASEYQISLKSFTERRSF